MNNQDDVSRRRMHLRFTIPQLARAVHRDQLRDKSHFQEQQMQWRARHQHWVDQDVRAVLAGACGGHSQTILSQGQGC